MYGSCLLLLRRLADGTKAQHRTEGFAPNTHKWSGSSSGCVVAGKLSHVLNGLKNDHRNPYSEYATVSAIGGSIPGRCKYIFSPPKACRQAPRPTQPPSLSPGVVRWRHEADHSPPPSAEVKKKWGYTSTSPICLHGVERYNVARS
jgi:hypothetical protein